MINLDIDWASARSRPINWVRSCDNVADSYPRGIAHGVQKDAVQNGVGAVRGSRPLEFDFELVANPRGRFLTMTDRNTVGLTGRVLLSREEYTEDLQEDERWARFESMGFTRPDPDSIGARGQGKFVFLAASKPKLIIYDSLRSDDTYRLGYTQAQLNDCPIVHFDGEAGGERLRDLTGLPPLAQVGTRVIIVDPVDELVRAVRDGELLASIEETWFRLIEKSKARIRVIADERTDLAELPRPYPIPAEDTDAVKVWRIENATIPIGSERYRVKRLHVGFQVGGRVPEDLRGIAVVHFGMKICSIPMDAAADVRDSVFGFIEFDTDLDRELRKTQNQSPNHYELNWRRRVPQAIKNFIEDQLRQFGEAKLGLKTDIRARRERVHADAERWALQQLSRFGRELDLFAGHGSVRKPGGNGDTPRKDIGLAIRQLHFPDAGRAPRVNWGESIEGFTVEAFNLTSGARSVGVSVFVLHGNRQVYSCQQRVVIDLPSGRKHSFGPLVVEVSKTLFPEPGHYRLRALMVDAVDGTRLDELNRHIWVEQDPPFRAPFDIQAARQFLPPYENRQWLMQVDADGFATLLYNESHPAHRYAQDIERDLQLYFLDVCLEGAMYLILSRPVGEDGPDYHPLDTSKVEESPKEAFSQLLGKMAEFRGRIYSGLA